MEWHFGNNPCPHGKTYLMEDGDCYRCPLYQECTSAVEGDKDNEDRDCLDGDWSVSRKEPL